MFTRKEIEQAIATLEANQVVLTEDVFTLTLDALRAKLAQLQTAPTSQQHVQMTILVADMSGFTSMSEFMDAETVRDTINAVWDRLDNVIVSWGGVVHKHVGDAVIALFGLPVTRDDDGERAVQAALDMQMELMLFNEKNTGLLTGNQDLHMRIGIHTGPVVLGEVGAKNEYTVVGDAMTIANELEKYAPLDGILISQALYEQVHLYFDVESQTAVSLGEREKLTNVYAVEREKPQALRQMRGRASFLDNRLVGRNDILDELQNTLQLSIETSQPQVVTMLGRTGIGKSRLLYEFERLLTVMPDRAAIFKGGAADTAEWENYSLIRDLFVNYFDIRRRNSPAVARRKLLTGLTQYVHGADVDREANVVAQLLGFAVDELYEAELMQASFQEIRMAAFATMAAYFRALAEDYEAIVLFLEDIHWADEGSFDWLEYIVQECSDLPVYVVCTARPVLFEKRPSWQATQSAAEGTYHYIELQPLSFIDSRHLLTEMVSDVVAFPLTLTDQIVTGSDGVPLRLEEIVRILRLQGVIQSGNKGGYVDMEPLIALDGALSLQNLLQSQMRELPDVEQALLKKASVVGLTFWHDTLVHLRQDDEAPLTLDEVLLLLLTLEQKGWVYQQRGTAFPDSQAFNFRHEFVHDAIYESIASDVRQQFHVQSATWLVTNQVEQATRYASVVADHFVRAEQWAEASSWYSRAAEQALAQNAQETAVNYYRHASRLLPDDLKTQNQRVRIHSDLGYLLCWMGSYDEAMESFMVVQTIAQSIDNQIAESRALEGEYLVHYFQEDWDAALKVCDELAALATKIDTPRLTVSALTSKGQVLAQIGETSTAVSLARQAYELGKEVDDPLAKGLSQALLGTIGVQLGHMAQALQATELALAYFQRAGNRLRERWMMAQLGDIAADQHNLEAAVAEYTECFQQAWTSRDFYSAVLSCRRLGDLAQRQWLFEEADMYYKRAHQLAEKASNEIYLAMIANDLGQLYLAQATLVPKSTMAFAQKEAYLQDAYRWLEKALKLGRQHNKLLTVCTAVAGLARLFLEDHLLEEAEAQAVESVTIIEDVVQKQAGRQAKRVAAFVWRILGEVLAKVPQNEAKVNINGQVLDATDCFTNSLKIWNELGDSDLLGKARTLRQWAIYELHQGNNKRFASMRAEAVRIYQQLGSEEDVNMTTSLLA